MDTFGALTKPELKAFLVAHDNELMRMKDILNKGNVKEAKYHGMVNTIMMAYNCRMKPNLVEGKRKQPSVAKDLARFADDYEDEPDTNNITVSTIRLGEVDRIQPSELLGCSMWRANTVRLFKLNERDNEMHVDPAADVTNDLKI